MSETGGLTYCETQCELRGKLPCAYLALEGLSLAVEGIGGPDMPVHDYGTGTVIRTGDMAASHGNDARKIAAACAKRVSNGKDPILLDDYDSPSP